MSTLAHLHWAKNHHKDMNAAAAVHSNTSVPVAYSSLSGDHRAAI